MRAIVLTFDCLPAQWLSCFGHEWIETPAFDQLAAQAAVFNQHFVEIPAAVGPQHPWWTGRFEFFQARQEGQSSSVWSELLREAGVKRHLLAESLSGLPVELFDSAEEVAGADGLGEPHENVPFARLLERARDWLREAPTDERCVLWLHSRGVPTPWCPPKFFAELYLEELSDSELAEEGQEAELSLAVQSMLEQLANDSELRELVLSQRLFALSEDDGSELGLSQFDDSYLLLLRELSRLLFAGYVTLLDHCLGKFQPMLLTDSPETDSTLFVLTAAYGASFGERLPLIPERLQGRSDSELTDEWLWTPLMLLNGTQHGLGTRHRELVQPIDLPPTLLSWFKIQQPESSSQRGINLNELAAGQTAVCREVAIHYATDGELGIRDAHYLLRGLDASLTEHGSSDAESDEADEQASRALLFVRPDDPYQINDVADQSHELVDEMKARLGECLKQGGQSM